MSKKEDRRQRRVEVTLTIRRAGDAPSGSDCHVEASDRSLPSCSTWKKRKIEKSRKGLGGVEGEIFMVHRLNAAPFSLSS